MEIIVFIFSFCFVNAYCSPADDKTANFNMKNVLPFLNLHCEQCRNKNPFALFQVAFFVGYKVKVLTKQTR
jgi:hypothetical protein